MSDRSTRLEQALHVWLASEEQGGSREELLARNPDLRDLLEPLCGDPDAAEPEGERVLGDYRLLREIGRGGMGVVYEAQQLSLDRRVAVKVLAPELAARPTTIARFRREALHLARLQHPGILRVLDVGEDGGEHWLAMELVDGDALDRSIDRLRARGGHERDSLRTIVAVIEQVAVALQHAHDAGLVHRDVKPSNILLRKDGQAVLGDFGLARDESAPGLTQVGAVAGTPHYLSPEHVLSGSDAVDARSDVFALGVTLYEGITLRLPFDGATPERILHRIAHRDPIDPRRLRRGVPVDLAAIVQKALEKDPARRYPSAGAFAADLRAFLELRPVQARPLSRFTRVRRWVRREPLQAGLAAALVLAVILGGYLLGRWPDLREAESARRERAYEDELVAGLTSAVVRDGASGVEHFRRALALLPASTEAIAGLCYGVYQAAGCEAALAELARRIDADAADESIERVRALLLRRCHRDAEAKELEAKLGDPSTPSAMWLTALTLLDDASDRAAIARAASLMADAIRCAPQPRLLYYAQWAATLAYLGDDAARRQCADSLARLWPEHPVALSFAGMSLVRIDPERAVALLRESLRRGARDPLVLVNVSLALECGGHHAEAVEEAHRAFAQPDLRGPAFDHARNQLITVLRRADDPREGEECERWYRKEPDDLSAMVRYGEYTALHGDAARGVELLRAACARAPDDAGNAWSLAYVLAQTGEVREALDILHGIAARAPTHEATHALIEDLYEESGARESVLAELDRWAHARPDDLDAWTRDARAQAEASGPDAARRALEAAEHADYLAGGKDPELLELRAGALERLGDAAEAARLRARAATAARHAGS